MLKKFGMNECKPVKTPMQTRSVLVKEEKEQLLTKGEITMCGKNIPYREAIGALRYLASGSRPDIEYAVNILSRKQTNPTMNDWSQVKRIFRYLQGTKELGLIFHGNKDDLAVYTDASYKDCNLTQRSTMGILIKLYDDTIFWVTKRQPRIAHSTCEAEYIALNEGIHEMMSINGITIRTLNKSLYPANVYCDNKATIKCTQTSGKPKLKHLINPHSHLVRESVELNEIKIHWLESCAQLADILTKALPIVQHEFLREQILN